MPLLPLSLGEPAPANDGRAVKVKIAGVVYAAFLTKSRLVCFSFIVVPFFGIFGHPGRLLQAHFTTIITQKKIFLDRFRVGFLYKIRKLTTSEDCRDRCREPVFSMVNNEPATGAFCARTDPCSVPPPHQIDYLGAYPSIAETALPGAGL